ncbi:hypothetical protein [Nocardia wallacei]
MRRIRNLLYVAEGMCGRGVGSALRRTQVIAADDTGTVAQRSPL